MIIKDDKLKGKYTKVANDLICNTELSVNARVILIYLLSKPKEWIVAMSDIRKNCIDLGKDTMQAAFKQLREHGYASLHKIRNQAGHVDGSEYTIYQNPGFNPFYTDSLNSRQPEKPAAGITDSRKTRRYSKKDSYKERVEERRNFIKEKKIAPACALPLQNCVSVPEDYQKEFDRLNAKVGVGFTVDEFYQMVLHLSEQWGKESFLSAYRLCKKNITGNAIHSIDDLQSKIIDYYTPSADILSKL